MPLGLLFGIDDLLELQVSLLEHLLEMNLVLALGRDRVGHLQLALAEDAAGDRNTLLGGVVLHIVRALVNVSSAVILVPTIRVFVAFIAEIGVGSAPEGGQTAAEVALELDMAKPVLLASVLFTDAHVIQPAALAHKLLLFHVQLLGLLSELLVLTVDIPTEEGGVAALTFIEFAHVQGVLKRFLIESISRILESLVVLKHVVLLELFQGVLAKSALENAHGSELLSDLWHRVGTVEVLLAARALHEVEGDALGAPSMAQKLSDAARVEDVAAVELHAGLFAEGVAADLAIVELGSLIA